MRLRFRFVLETVFLAFVPNLAAYCVLLGLGFVVHFVLGKFPYGTIVVWVCGIALSLLVVHLMGLLHRIHVVVESLLALPRWRRILLGLSTICVIAAFVWLRWWLAWAVLLGCNALIRALKHLDMASQVSWESPSIGTSSTSNAGKAAKLVAVARPSHPGSLSS